jgi:hypothetical protein
MNWEGGCGSGSLPRWYLMEISQNETALKKTWFCGLRTAAATDAGNFASPDTSQRNSQVSSRIFNFDFKGHVTHGTKLRFRPAISKP